MRKAIIYLILALLIISPFQQALAISTNYRYTGQELDSPSGMYNYGQRYYMPEVGKFNRPDPVLNNLHDPQKLKQQTDQDLEQFLSNPQNLNSYSYVQNNPVVYTDPLGEAKVYIRERGVQNSKSKDTKEILGHTMIEVDGTYYGFAPTNKPTDDIQELIASDFKEEYKNQKWNVVDIGQDYDEAIINEFNQLKEQGQNIEGGEYNLLMNNCTQKADKILKKVGVFLKLSATPLTPSQLLRKFKTINVIDSLIKLFNKDYNILVKDIWTEIIN